MVPLCNATETCGQQADLTGNRCIVHLGNVIQRHDFSDDIAWESNASFFLIDMVFHKIYLSNENS